jgi:hypothetical protein
MTINTTGPGAVITMRSFVHDMPHAQFTFRAAKGKVYVFMLMGVQNKDGSHELDVMQVMDDLGWMPKKDHKAS